jgi:hypothetical protein
VEAKELCGFAARRRAVRKNWRLEHLADNPTAVALNRTEQKSASTAGAPARSGLKPKGVSQMQQQICRFADDTVIAKDRDLDKQQAIEPHPLQRIKGVTHSHLTSPLAPLKHQQIAIRAYSYWHERGCSEGAAEEDWLRAEKDIHNESKVGLFDRAPLGLPH